jgi:ribosome-associated toxin RatA of RatAB toxin-antitoxin module
MRPGLISGILMLTLCAASFADEAIQLSLKKRDGGVYYVQAKFTTCASRRIVWAVLTDYQNLHTFISTMDKSSIRSRNGNSTIVEQQFSARYFIFKKTFQVRLQVTEDPDRMITFEDILKKNFDSYKGSWEITEDSGGTHIFYSLEFIPNFTAPESIQTSQSIHSVENLVRQVGTEIRRRCPRSTIGAEVGRGRAFLKREVSYGYQ